MTQLEDHVVALERRVAELEERIQETGRRLLFASEVEVADVVHHGSSETSAIRADLNATIEATSEVNKRVASAGRSLLFDSETPGEPS